MLAWSIINPFVWIQGAPPAGWQPGLETFWPILVEGLLVSIALGLIGCWLVVRGMSLLGDALSHSVLPGIVIGFLIGRSLQSVWILIGATAMGMGAAVLVQSVQQHSRVKEDASLGIVFTTLFALGVVLINLFAGQTDLDPGCVLYGQVEYFLLTPTKILPMAAILAGLLLLLFLFYRHLLISTFDQQLARSMRIPASLIHYSLMAALSLTTVASFEAVGAILAVALLVTPGSTARLWTDRMPVMLLIATVHAALSTIVGYFLSHPVILNTSASGAISVAGFGLFAISWVIAPRKGLLKQWRTRRALRHTMADENLVKGIHNLVGAPTDGAATTASIDESRLREEMHATMSNFDRALRRTAAKGWVMVGGGKVALTHAGHARAESLAHAHELWEQYLKKEVGVAADHLHDPAEWIEHYLDENRIKELKATLG